MVVSEQVSLGLWATVSADMVAFDARSNEAVADGTTAKRGVPPCFLTLLTSSFC
jgi:hypothetical protein